MFNLPCGTLLLISCLHYVIGRNGFQCACSLSAPIWLAWECLSAYTRITVHVSQMTPLKAPFALSSLSSLATSDRPSFVITLLWLPCSLFSVTRIQFSTFSHRSDIYDAQFSMCWVLHNPSCVLESQPPMDEIRQWQCTWNVTRTISITPAKCKKKNESRENLDWQGTER